MLPATCTAKHGASTSGLQYLSGYGQEHCREALAGAVPRGQFSPPWVPFGLYAEKFSATAFTAPRHENLRTWFCRMSVLHGEFALLPASCWHTAPLIEGLLRPNQTRWDPLPLATEMGDCVDSLTTLVVGGDARLQVGMAAHV
jgi:homogentisate 1,2-dioxygenase